MTTVKAVLIKPLDGLAEGTEREFDKLDFDRLVAQGAVRAATSDGEKAAAAPINKMAPAVTNKAIPGAVSPDHDADVRLADARPKAKT